MSCYICSTFKHYNIVLSILFSIYAIRVCASAMGKQPKEFYLMSETLIPSTFQSSTESVSLQNHSQINKLYLEYGLVKNFTLITEILDIKDLNLIALNASRPYPFKKNIYLGYDHFFGKIGLNYLLIINQIYSTSTQIFYQSGNIYQQPKNKDYIKGSQEISVGLVHSINYYPKVGLPKKIYLTAKGFIGSYYTLGKFSNEGHLIWGMEIKQISFEVGLRHKANTLNIKHAPYKSKELNLPSQFNYLTSEINSLIKIRNFENQTDLSFKIGCNLTQQQGMEFGIYRHFNGYGKPSTAYGIGYRIQG